MDFYLHTHSSRLRRKPNRAIHVSMYSPLPPVERGNLFRWRTTLPSGDSFDLWTFCQARCRWLARHPSMVFAGGSVTFAELFRTAELLADELAKSGIHESSSVAVI